MSYLTRLSQQTGLAPAVPQVQPAESPPMGLRQVEGFVAPGSPDLNRSVEPSTLPTNAAAPNPDPSSFSGLQAPHQESASWDFPPTMAPVQPGPELAQQGLSEPRPPHPADWRVTDSGVTVPSASPETRADSAQPSVILPAVTVEQAPAPKTLPMAASSSPAMTDLQTLQTVRDWVSASPEESRNVETVPDSGLPQAVPTAPATIQVVNPADLAISPFNRLNLRQTSSPWDTAMNSTLFPASTTEPATVISIGSIQVTVEGPPAPSAPAPARRESPRPSTRLSRHYLRLR